MTSDDRPPGDAEALAHELRTPLAVIAGYAELLAARGDDQTRRQAAAGISEAAARLGALVDELAERVAGRDGGVESQQDESSGSPL